MEVRSLTWQGVQLGPQGLLMLVDHLNQSLKQFDVLMVGLRMGVALAGAATSGNETVPIAHFWRELLQTLEVTTFFRNVTLVVFDDVPQLPGYPGICAGSGNVSACTGTEVASRAALKLRPDILGLNLTTAKFMNLHRLFCAQGYCGPMVPGTQTYAYMDDNHLSVAGSLYLAPFICSFLKPLL